MKIQVIDNILSVSKVKTLKNIDFNQEFIFLAKTDEEISIVHDKDFKLENVIEESNYWRAFRVDDVLDFNLVGIIKKISTLLANNNIPIFVVSTYNTDYILVQETNFPKTLEVLKKNDYEIEKKAL